jgi:hypothetical protein
MDMRRLILLTVLLGLPLIIASPASATPPTREPLIAEDFTLTDHCSFNIIVEFVQNNEVATTFYDQDGNVVRQLVTGALKVRLTNEEVPENSLLFNISGPGEFTPQQDGSTLLVGEGTWINFGIVNLPGQVLLSNGHFEAVISPEGEFTMTEIPNNSVDVCGLID